CDLRREMVSGCETPYSIRNIKNSCMDGWHRVYVMVQRDGPCIQLTSCNTQQTTGRVEPKRTRVVFPYPMNTIAWQSVPAGQRGKSSILQPAEPAFGRDPECPVLIEPELAHTAGGQTIGRTV